MEHQMKETQMNQIMRKIDGHSSCFMEQCFPIIVEITWGLFEDLWGLKQSFLKANFEVNQEQR